MSYLVNLASEARHTISVTPSTHCTYELLRSTIQVPRYCRYQSIVCTSTLLVTVGTTALVLYCFKYTDIVMSSTRYDIQYQVGACCVSRHVYTCIAPTTHDPTTPRPASDWTRAPCRNMSTVVLALASINASPRRHRGGVLQYKYRKGNMGNISL